MHDVKRYANVDLKIAVKKMILAPLVHLKYVSNIIFKGIPWIRMHFCQGSSSLWFLADQRCLSALYNLIFRMHVPHSYKSWVDPMGIFSIEKCIISLTVGNVLVCTKQRQIWYIIEMNNFFFPVESSICNRFNSNTNLTLHTHSLKSKITD